MHQCRYEPVRVVGGFVPQRLAVMAEESDIRIVDHVASLKWHGVVLRAVEPVSVADGLRTTAIEPACEVTHRMISMRLEVEGWPAVGRAAPNCIGDRLR